MSKCRNCGRRMQYRRDFCSEDCYGEFMEEVERNDPDNEDEEDEE